MCTMMKEPTAARAPGKILLLKTAIQHIKSNSIVGSDNGAIAAMVAAGTALLYHLQQDRILLLRIGKQAGMKAKMPSSDRIPAISAVLHDVRLFRALLRMLQANDSTAATAAGSSFPSGEPRSGSFTSGGGPGGIGGGNSRKRSLSNVSELSDHGGGGGNQHRMAKTMSPVPHHAARGATLLSRNNNKPVSANISVLAANILYAALRHLDHWPAVLAQLYAQDSFGSRHWVDDERCAGLVQNLQLTHAAAASIGDENDSLAQARLHDAILVSRAYRSIVERGEDASDEDDMDADVSPPALVRRGSMSSTTSTGRSQLTVSNLSRRGGSVKQTAENGSTMDVDGDGNSSSSGDEDGDDHAQVMVSSQVPSQQLPEDEPPMNPPNGALPSMSSMNNVTMRARLYPVSPNGVEMTRVRQRFYGQNLVDALAYITQCLNERLDMKSKQNSGLLQALPAFVPIAAVRAVVAANLERWLQSPALAGLARGLLTVAVAHVKKCDPPLDSDLNLIRRVAAMRLKANQMNTHLDSIAAIARRLPTTDVANMLFSEFFKQFIRADGVAGESTTGALTMIAGVYKVLSIRVSCDAMAAAVLTFLAHPNIISDTAGTATDRARLVQKIRRLLRSVSAELGSQFDAQALLRALLSFDVSSDSWTIKDEEDKGRLMLQCFILSVPLVDGKKVHDDAVARENELRHLLTRIRKDLLAWCCSDYGKLCARKIETKRKEHEVGAGAPDFSSALSEAESEIIPAWLNTIRCLLMLEEPQSPLMRRFLCANTVDDESNESADDVEVLAQCYKIGTYVDDDQFRVVLRAATARSPTITKSMAVQIIENLLDGARKSFRRSLRFQDPGLLWQLYDLALYEPAERSFAAHPSNGEMNGDLDIPRLAHPALWWRITFVALIVCYCAPATIAEEVWNHHPTLRCLMKMIVSGKYRFPTVDCSDAERGNIKKGEQDARDQEARLAATLFLPPLKSSSEEAKKTGSRASRRIRKQQEEKESAARQAELTRRQELLKAAQRTIMLWDPDGPARKPPKECGDLLLAVEHSFDIAATLRRSEQPDFILMTIGQTSRDAIERAYDWLIPIISAVPATIQRLPSSTSCLLLLKAYGVDGDERRQLKQLASPLLTHVKESLAGEYGEQDAKTALELLMVDVASSNPDRRRCGRRVLSDAIGDNTHSDSKDTNSSWLTSIAATKFAHSLVPDTIRYAVKSASFERARVLRTILLSLEKLFAFAQSEALIVDQSFADVLLSLIPSRANIISDCMEQHVDLANLVAATLYDCLCRPESIATHRSDMKSIATITMDARDELTTVRYEADVRLLQSICVLLSIWKEPAHKPGDNDCSTAQKLIDLLLRPASGDAGGDEKGLASATITGSGCLAVNVESWILLAKARSDVIAKQAALSAPATYLARLLFSSGLSKVSLVAMVDRLGRIGDAAEDRNAAYRTLVDASASNTWDIGRVGSEKDRLLRLHGRIMAYMRVHRCATEETMSMTFLEWLTAEIGRLDTLRRKGKPSKKTKSKAQASLSTMNQVQHLIQQMRDADLSEILDPTDWPTLEGAEDLQFRCINERRVANGGAIRCAKGGDGTRITSAITSFVAAGDAESLSGLLRNFEATGDCTVTGDEVAEILFDSLLKGPFRSDVQFGRAVLHWVAHVLRRGAKSTLWVSLFAKYYDGDKAFRELLDGLAHTCAKQWDIAHIRLFITWFADGRQVGQLDEARVCTFMLCVLNILQRHDKKTQLQVLRLSIRALSDLPAQSILDRRHCLPTPMLLVLRLIMHDNDILQECTDILSNELTELGPSKSLARRAFLSTLLRLYLLKPRHMNLNSSAVRGHLLEGAEYYSSSWMSWCCALDDTMRDVLYAMLHPAGGDVRAAAKPLVDLTRQHPLLLLKQTRNVVTLLRRDAGRTSQQIAQDAAGINAVTIGRPVTEPAAASVKYDDKEMVFSVWYWGMAYTELFWLTILDVFSAMPREVLFRSGPQLGLLDVINVCLQLVLIQTHLKTASADKTQASRLKSKLSDFCNAFETQNNKAWRRWLASRVNRDDDDSDQIRHLLVGCDVMTAAKAMETLRSEDNMDIDGE